MCIRRGGPHQPIADLKLIDDSQDCDPGTYGVPHEPTLTGNLNEEAGDSPIYLCFKRAVQPSSCMAQMVSGKWVGHGALMSRESESWTYGIQVAHQESNREEWRLSATSSVRQGWKLLGVNSSVAISGSLAHQTSEAWSDAWEVGKDRSISLVHEATDTGKYAWKFVFTFTDSCGHTEHAILRDVAITAGAWQEPCCIPGFAMDAPYYRTCHIEKAMIPGVEHCASVGENGGKLLGLPVALMSLFVLVFVLTGLNFSEHPGLLVAKLLKFLTTHRSCTMFGCKFA